MEQTDNTLNNLNPSWTVVAASVQGSAHMRREEPCQDSWGHSTHINPNTGVPTLVAAVADGAGSASMGLQGAKTATAACVHAAVALLQEAVEQYQPPQLEHVARQAILGAQEEVLKQAQEEQGDPRDYASTLLVVISDGQRTAAAQIGDGAVVAGTQSGGYEVITKPDRAEYANETTFITSNGATDKLQPTVREEGPTVQIAMFTDGIQNLALRQGQGEPVAHEPFFTAIFDWLMNQTDEDAAQSSLAKFLAGDRVRSRTNDDTTLLLATLIQPEPTSADRE